MLAEMARTGKLHAKMDIFVALGLCIGIKDHRYSEPVALGKRHIHDLPHISLSLILLPDADQTDIDIRLLFPVKLFAESLTAL